MAIPRLIASLLPRALLRFATRLRFPQLFLLCVVLFVVDLVLPDFIPFLDEILLGLLSLLLAGLKDNKNADTRDK